MLILINKIYKFKNWQVKTNNYSKKLKSFFVPLN